MTRATTKSGTAIAVPASSVGGNIPGRVGSARPGARRLIRARRHQTDRLAGGAGALGGLGEGHPQRCRARPAERPGVGLAAPASGGCRPAPHAIFEGVRSAAAAGGAATRDLAGSGDAEEHAAQVQAGVGAQSLQRLLWGQFVQGGQHVLPRLPGWCWRSGSPGRQERPRCAGS